MRTVMPLIALFLTTAAAPPTVPVAPAPNPELAQPPSSAVCRDRIEEVRDERGLPKLDRGTATQDEALFIAAVDKRIDGCSVMVMRNNTSDIRPLPAPPEGAPLLQRIPGK